MTTIQMQIEDELLEEVDRATRKLKTTRSTFTCDALRPYSINQPWPSWNTNTPRAM